MEKITFYDKSYNEKVEGFVIYKNRIQALIFVPKYYRNISQTMNYLVLAYYDPTLSPVWIQENQLLFQTE